MIDGYLSLLWATCVWFLVGCTLLLSTNYEFKDMVKRPYLVFGLGVGCHSLILFIYLILGFELTITTSLLAALPTILSWLIIRALCPRRSTWRLLRPPATLGLDKDTKLIKSMTLFCQLIILVQVVALIVAVTYMPENSDDGLARWGLKAKVLSHERSLKSDYFIDPHFSHSHPYYPLMIPLQMAHITVLDGDFNESAVRPLGAIFFIFMLMAFFDLLRHSGPDFHAWLFTAMLATIPRYTFDEGSANSMMADVPLAFFVLLTCILFIALKRNQRVGQAIVLGLCLASCGFTKAEGLHYAFIMLIAFVSACLLADRSRMRNYIKRLLVVSLVGSIALAPWLAFKQLNIEFEHANFPHQLTLSYVLAKIPRLIFVLPRLLLEGLDYTRYHISWILFYAGLIALGIRRRLGWTQWFLLITLVGFFCFYSLTFMLSAWWGQLDDDVCKRLMDFTIPRLILVTMPLVVYLTYLSPLVQKTQDTSSDSDPH